MEDISEIMVHVSKQEWAKQIREIKMREFEENIWKDARLIEELQEYDVEKHIPVIQRLMDHMHLLAVKRRLLHDKVA